jgi:hypothetical protein
MFPCEKSLEHVGNIFLEGSTQGALVWYFENIYKYKLFHNNMENEGKFVHKSVKGSCSTNMNCI